ncbi:hypothetical protein AOLI_G00278970 [Acnodon oligacanthus]
MEQKSEAANIVHFAGISSTRIRMGLEDVSQVKEGWACMVGGLTPTDEHRSGQLLGPDATFGTLKVLQSGQRDGRINQ